MQLCRRKPLLGTWVEVHCEAKANEDHLLALTQRCFQAMQSIQNQMSFHNPDSELSQINRYAWQKKIRLSTHMRRIFHLIDTLHQQSDGIFDPTIAPVLQSQSSLPKHSWQHKTMHYGNWHHVILEGDWVYFTRPVLIDLGGIAKGYAVDFAIQSIDENVRLIINAGGDIAMSHWQNQSVSITCKKHYRRTISMKNRAIASSAQYHLPTSHIINPKSQCAITNSKTISVFASQCVIADALTKIVWQQPDNKSLLQHYQADYVSY